MVRFVLLVSSWASVKGKRVAAVLTLTRLRSGSSLRESIERHRFAPATVHPRRSIESLLPSRLDDAKLQRSLLEPGGDPTAMNRYLTARALRLGYGGAVYAQGAV